MSSIPCRVQNSQDTVFCSHMRVNFCLIVLLYFDLSGDSVYEAIWNEAATDLLLVHVYKMPRISVSRIAKVALAVVTLVLVLHYTFNQENPG